MRHFAIALAAAVIGMLIALLLYDRLVVQPRDAARADALDRAAMFKVALSEYYMSNGHWPASAQEAGLGAPGSFAGGAVARIDVGANGVVVVTLNDRLVRGATVRLTPEITSSGLVDWHCSVPGNDVLRRYLPACRG